MAAECEAQRAAASQFNAPRDSASNAEGPLRVFGGALLGVGAGAIGVALLAMSANVSRSNCGGGEKCLEPALIGFIWGVGIGGALGAPVGAHLANRRQGSLLKSALASTALFGVEVFVLNATGGIRNRSRNDGILTPIQLGIPILEAVTATMIERASTPR